MILIPAERLAPETLEAIIEEFIGREGTDYGVREVSLADKVFQVGEQIRRGDVVIAYDYTLQSCTLLLKTEWDKRPQETE